MSPASGSNLKVLVDEALRDVSRADVPTSAILDKAIRIARLRRDGRNLIWLTMEARALGDDAAKARVIKEVRPFFGSYEELRTLWSGYAEELIEERTLEPKPLRGEENASLLAMSVREMEAHVESLGEAMDDASRGPTRTSWGPRCCSTFLTTRGITSISPGWRRG
jgi:hypothetical protein